MRHITCMGGRRVVSVRNCWNETTWKT